MSELRCVLADDEPLALGFLRSLLESHHEIEVIDACPDGVQALSAIQKASPDLVFLDIEMPGMGGFDVVKRLQPDVMPAIIFTTAFNHYAVSAFEVHAVDYVLKPLDSNRLGLAIERAKMRIANNQAERSAGKANVLNAIGRISDNDLPGLSTAIGVSQYPSNDSGQNNLLVRDSGKTHVVNQDYIDWVDAAGDYMCIHIGDKTLVARMTMKSLEEQLDPTQFSRIHRSTIVNTRKVKRLESVGKGDYVVHLQGGAQVKASRRYRAQLMTLLTLI